MDAGNVAKGWEGTKFKCTSFPVLELTPRSLSSRLATWLGYSCHSSTFVFFDYRIWKAASLFFYATCQSILLVNIEARVIGDVTLLPWMWYFTLWAALWSHNLKHLTLLFRCTPHTFFVFTQFLMNAFLYLYLKTNCYLFFPFFLKKINKYFKSWVLKIGCRYNNCSTATKPDKQCVIFSGMQVIS